MTHTGLEKPTTHDPLAMTHAGLDAPMTRDEAMTHGEVEENTGQMAWTGGLRWPMMAVAYGGAYDIGSGHGGLMMVFMSTMSFGFEDESKTRGRGRKRKGNEIMRKEEREESDNKK